MSRLFVSIGTLCLMLCFSQTVNAQVTVTGGLTAQQLVDQFAGPGIEIVPGSAQFANGNNNQFGSFVATGNAANIGITNGVVLTTGRVSDIDNAVPGDVIDFDVGFPFNDSDPDLAALEPNGNPINDAAVLRFEFVPKNDILQFNYIFASDEYEEFAAGCADPGGSNFNDLFAFFLSGPKTAGTYGGKTNLALVPNDITIPTFTTEIVSIPTINILNNSQFYVSNSDQYVTQCPAEPHGINNTDFGFDGYSVVLPVRATVNPCDTYLIEFKVGDVVDEAFDTGVFLEAGSFGAPGLAGSSDQTDADGNLIYFEGCTSANSFFTVDRPVGTSGPVDVDIFYSGDATPGVDYVPLPTVVSFPTGVDQVTVPVEPLFDGVTEPVPDTLKIRIPIPDCDTTGTPDSVRLNLVIRDVDTLSTDLPDTLFVCEGAPVNLSPAILGGIAENKDHTWLLDGVVISDTNTVSIASLDTTSTLTFEIIDSCSTPDYTKDVVLYINLYDDSVSIETKDLQCNGSDDGFIDISVANSPAESGPLEFTIDNGVTYGPDSLFEDLAEGNYTVIVRDTNGCTIPPRPLALSAPGALGVIIDEEQDVSCFGANDGEVTVSAVGGTAPYVFNIDGGPFSADPTFDNLAPGTYTITVRDDSLCTDDIVFTITEPAELIASVEWVKGETCFGDDDGAIKVTATGGTLPLSFSIDNGANFQSDSLFDPLSPGNYDVVIEDDSGCTVGPLPTVVEDADELLIDNIIVTDVDCQGATTGEIEIIASGGSGTIQYSIDAGTNYDPGNTFTGLTAGDYPVQIIDDSLCTVGPVLTTIDQPTDLTLSFDSKVDESCFGIEDGEIELSATGGTAPYEFSLDGVNYQGSGSFDDLPSGTYQAFVQDDNGCIDGPIAIDIIAAPVFTADTLLSKDIRCFGDDDGLIYFTRVGGTDPVEFSIDGGTSWSADSQFVNLTPNTYQLRVRDGNG